MPDALTISNDGPDIVETNYWQTDMAKAGKFYLSTNAGCFRVLVPSMHSGAVRDMRAAYTCVVSRGPYPDLRLPDALEIVFDDGSEEPWSLHLSPASCDRMPLDQDTAQAWTLAVWVHRVGTTGRKALEKPCHYRRVRRLPDLRPWQP